MSAPTPDQYIEVCGSDNPSTGNIIRTSLYAPGFLSVSRHDMQRALDAAAGDQIYLSLPDTSEEQVIFGFANDGYIDRVLCDTQQDKTYVDGVEIDLGDRQRKLLHYFALNAGITMSDQDILTNAIEDPESLLNPEITLRMLVSRVRQKLGSELGHPSKGALRRYQGIGYQALLRFTPSLR